MSIPYVPMETSKRFKVPRTLAADFRAFLNQDLPNQVMTFELIPDWYAQFEDGYEQQFIRGEIYPDSTKSRYENTDNNMNFRADVESGIKKGDMIIQPDGKIFLLDWFVALESNNAPSRAVRCNLKLTISRYVEETVDRDGYLLTPEGWNVVVDKLPVNAYRYDGRPEYSSVSGTPGVTPNALTLLSCQYNNQTKNIRIDDQFVWGVDTYRVVDIDRVGIDISESFGTLKIQARKVEGGINMSHGDKNE